MTTVEMFNDIIAENKGILTAGKMMNLIKKLAEKKQYNEIPYGIGLLMNFQNGKDVQRAYYNVIDIAITNRDFDIAEKYNALTADEDLKQEWTEIIAEKKGL